MTVDIKVVPVAELDKYIGREFGPTAWVELDQGKIDQFAHLTLDRQFIHIDPVNAKRTPFGGTIAHGFLTLSMLAYFQSQANVLPMGTMMGVNYGLNKVRFLQPVKSGQRVRGRLQPLSFVTKAPGQILATYEMSVEIEGESKPALVAETLTMFYVP